MQRINKLQVAFARMRVRSNRRRFAYADELLTKLAPMLREEERLYWSMIRGKHYDMASWTHKRVQALEEMEVRWKRVREHAMRFLGYRTVDDARWHVRIKPRIKYWSAATGYSRLE